MGTSADTVCKEFTSCSTCTDDTKHPGTRCGWCPAAAACIPRSGMYRMIPSWLIDIINTDPTKDCGAADFKHSKGQCSDDTCSEYTNCKDCAGSLACGWCATTNQCLSKDALARSIEQSVGSGSGSGSAPTPLCGSSPTSFVIASGSCPLPVCSAITDCAVCTNTTGCGFCRDSQKCISVDGNGSSLGGSSGSSGCAQGSIFRRAYQCPCSVIKNCSDCAQRPGCGFCKSSSKCVNLDNNSIPEPEDCDANGVATSASQCAPGATLRRISERIDISSINTTDTRRAQDNLLGGQELNVPPYSGPRGAGDTQVSPAETSRYVSGNGVLHRLGDPNRPPSATNTTGLNEPPLEAYVKMLVNSHLAENGIPSNEPFQDNEDV